MITLGYPQRQRGFTLVELVVVIVLVGILAAMAAPRFFEREDFDSRGFSDELIAALRYAQKLSAHSGCKVQVVIDANSERFDLYYPDGTLIGANSCGHGRGAAGTPSYANAIAVPRPDSTTAYATAAPAGVDIANGLSLYFDGQGRPSNSGTVSIGSHSLRVEANSGFAHRL